MRNEAKSLRINSSQNVVYSNPTIGAKSEENQEKKVSNPVQTQPTDHNRTGNNYS